jgi:hypothetical protein
LTAVGQKNTFQNGERTNEKPEVREDEIKIDNQDQAGNEIKTENSTMNLVHLNLLFSLVLE